METGVGKEPGNGRNRRAPRPPTWRRPRPKSPRATTDLSCTPFTYLRVGPADPLTYLLSCVSMNRPNLSTPWRTHICATCLLPAATGSASCRRW